MKYLSHKKSFKATVDPEVLQGTKSGYVKVDFSQLLDSDEKNESKYVVGGRVYFEASLFGTYVNSFTYKGFFDQEGYEEPASFLKRITTQGMIWLIVASVVVLGVLIYVVYRCCCKKDEGLRKKKPKNE